MIELSQEKSFILQKVFVSEQQHVYKMLEFQVCRPAYDSDKNDTLETFISNWVLDILIQYSI